MGLYVNPGNEAFRQAVADELYIDKTNLISRINQKLNKSRTKHLCVSRPRRFGKSMAAEFGSVFDVNSYGLPDVLRQIYAQTKQGFMNAVEGPRWEGIIRALERSENLLKSTWAMDEKAIANEIETIYQET